MLPHAPESPGSLIPSSSGLIAPTRAQGFYHLDCKPQGQHTHLVGTTQLQSAPSASSHQMTLLQYLRDRLPLSQFERKRKTHFPHKSWFYRTSFLCRTCNPQSYKSETYIQKEKSPGNSIRKPSPQQQLFKVECVNMCPCPSPGCNLTTHYVKICDTRT